MRVFENKMLRKIFGPKENKSNRETEISGFHCGEYENDILLGYCTVSTSTRLHGAISQKAVVFNRETEKIIGMKNF
jgi:hypothetical protein